MLVKSAKLLLNYRRCFLCCCEHCDWHFWQRCQEPHRRDAPKCARILLLSYDQDAHFLFLRAGIWCFHHHRWWTKTLEFGRNLRLVLAKNEQTILFFWDFFRFSMYRDGFKETATLWVWHWQRLLPSPAYSAFTFWMQNEGIPTLYSVINSLKYCVAKFSHTACLYIFHCLWDQGKVMILQ